MSGKQNRPASGKGQSASVNKKPEQFSFESLLDEIESEEKKVTESFPDIADAFDDDIVDIEELDELDDLSDDSDELDDDLDDLEDLDDDFDMDEEEAEVVPVASAEWANTAESDDEAESSDGNFWDEPGNKPAGLLDSIRSAIQGGKDGKNNLAPLVIIALLAVIIIILLMQNCNCGGKQKQEDWFDTSAIEGTLPGKSPEEIQAMLNQIVEEGMFNISIAPVIVFENAEAQGQARIENIPANHYHMSVKITLDDTSETIYESKGIRPGQYIEYITLQKALQPGEYAATAMFSAYDADDLSERVAVKITIIVE